MSKTDNLSTFLQKKLMLGQNIITVAFAMFLRHQSACAVTFQSVLGLQASLVLYSPLISEGRRLAQENHLTWLDLHVK